MLLEDLAELPKIHFQIIVVDLVEKVEHKTSVKNASSYLRIWSERRESSIF